MTENKNWAQEAFHVDVITGRLSKLHGERPGVVGSWDERGRSSSVSRNLVER